MEVDALPTRTDITSDGHGYLAGLELRDDPPPVLGLGLTVDHVSRVHTCGIIKKRLGEIEKSNGAYTLSQKVVSHIDHGWHTVLLDDHPLP